MDDLVCSLLSFVTQTVASAVVEDIKETNEHIPEENVKAQVNGLATDFSKQVLKNLAKDLSLKTETLEEQIEKNSTAVLFRFLGIVHERLRNEFEKINKTLQIIQDAEFKLAKQKFEEGLRWYHWKNHVDNFKSSMLVARSYAEVASVKLTNVDDLFFCYLIYLYCTFLETSNFGEKLYDGLLGVYNVLHAFCQHHLKAITSELKKDKKQELLKKSLGFSYVVEKFIRNVISTIVAIDEMEEKYNTFDINKKTTLKINQIFDSTKNDNEQDILMKLDWIPNVLAGDFIGRFSDNQIQMDKVKKRKVLGMLDYGDVTSHDHEEICKTLRDNNIFVNREMVTFKNDDNDEKFSLGWNQCFNFMKNHYSMSGLDVALLTRFYKRGIEDANFGEDIEDDENKNTNEKHANEKHANEKLQLTPLNMDDDDMSDDFNKTFSKSSINVPMLKFIKSKNENKDKDKDRDRGDSDLDIDDDDDDNSDDNSKSKKKFN